MLRRILSCTILSLILSHCSPKQEIKVLPLDKFDVNPEYILDGNRLQLLSPALKLNESMDFKAYYHHLVYDGEQDDTFSVLSPIAFSDTITDYQFVSDHSYAYIILMQDAMKKAGLQDSLFPEMELVVYSPKFESEYISNKKAIIGALFPLNE